MPRTYHNSSNLSRFERTIRVELGNEEKVKAKAYGVAIKIEEVEAPSITITFKGAQTVIGVETLESIGVKLDPTTGRLEFTRPRGMAYFYVTPARC